MLTEEQARLERCIGPPNCGRRSGQIRVCVASGCKMAWRWGPDDAALNERHHGRDATSEFGYCGLAGKPATG